jgi:hypothetical protein
MERGMNGMNRTVAALVGVVVILVVVLAFVLGRQSAGPTPAAQPGSVNKMVGAPVGPALATNQATPGPAASGDPDDALSRWLAGGWAEVSTNCETDTGVWYDPSGRYGAAEAEGIWRIEHGELIVTVTHEAVGDPEAEEYTGLPNPRAEHMRLTRESQDRLTLVIEGRPVRMMRCPLAHHSFAT